jgi:hypothetical protein
VTFYVIIHLVFVFSKVSELIGSMQMSDDVITRCCALIGHAGLVTIATPRTSQLETAHGRTNSSGQDAGLASFNYLLTNSKLVTQNWKSPIPGQNSTIRQKI